MNKLTKFGILGVLILIAAWTGWDMINRGNQELLWGYRPLVLFLSLWAFIVLGRRFTFKKLDKDWHLLGLSSLSGVLLAVGFPDVIPIPLLLFVGFVPLLMVEKILADRAETTDKKALLRYGYNAFVIWNVLATYWVANTAFIAGIVAIWVNSFFMCIPWLVFHQTKKVMPRLGYIALVVYWISFEYLHLNWEISWPWLTLGNGFAEFPSWVQWYEYTGVFGGTVWILGLNILLFQWWTKYSADKSIAYKGLILPALLILIPIAVSLLMYSNYEEKGEATEVVVIQPNFEPHYEKFNISENAQLTRFLQLAERELDEDTDYLVFPETAFGLLNADKLNQERLIARMRTFLEQYPNLKLITGLSTYNIFDEGEPHSRAVRESSRNGNTFFYEVQNVAVQIQAGEEDIPLYVKSKLVPGAEILPYREVFFFLEPLADLLGGSLAGHAIQDKREVLSSNSGKIAPVICYESVYGAYSTGYIRAGAQAIFVMTNDGWWDNTAGHRQHLLFSSLRAIETRRPVARSANTGISCFINQRGDILQPTNYDEPIAIKGEILLNDEITFYVKWKDILARISLFMMAIFLLNTLVKSRLST